MEEALKAKGLDAEPGPPELQALRNQAAFYHHSWKEYQATAQAVIKKLEKNGIVSLLFISHKHYLLLTVLIADEFRRKLATEVPNKFKSPRTQKTIIAHARACALELDKYPYVYKIENRETTNETMTKRRYDLGENVMKERTQLTHEVDENGQLRQAVASLSEIAKAQFQLLQGISRSPLPCPLLSTSILIWDCRKRTNQHTTATSILKSYYSSRPTL
jgi:hypothetical protein